MTRRTIRGLAKRRGVSEEEAERKVAVLFVNSPQRLRKERRNYAPALRRIGFKRQQNLLLEALHLQFDVEPSPSRKTPQHL